MAYVGFVTTVVCLVIMIVQIVGLGYGLEISTSGDWWAISILGAIAGLLMMFLSELERRE